MTVIVAVASPDGVWMGGDSGVTDNAGRKESGLEITNNIVIDKVRHVELPNGEELLWGGAGEHFGLQVIEYEHAWTEPCSDAKRWLWDECRRMWGLFTEEEHVWGRVHDSDYGEEVDIINMHLLFGFRGRLFAMSDDGSLDETTDDYLAIGSGAPWAQGSLFASAGENPQTRVATALEAALVHEISIRKPFTIKFVGIKES